MVGTILQQCQNLAPQSYINDFEEDIMDKLFKSAQHKDNNKHTSIKLKVVYCVPPYMQIVLGRYVLSISCGSPASSFTNYNLP